ncbi:hypothetical protein GCM10007164_27340 [Luteimonas padinae]|uniref:FmdB family zinc ribbon protein n=1 Tax=Luteimonas padinae TaxID=1714359 RepID=A0ABV6STV9_9GAMM|nr:hypothetical protein GCM10007164_27340 [Luteimonas padinae]
MEPQNARSIPLFPVTAMPIYAFRCAACGHEFDRLQKLSDPDPDTCPACAAQGGVGRKLTAPAFRLAGSGWYETDFKKDGDTKRNLAEGGEGAGKADGAKGDAPAATPAAGAAVKPGNAATAPSTSAPSASPASASAPAAAKPAGG